MNSERILVIAGFVLGGILVEQAGLGSRVRAGAWTALAIGLTGYTLLRIVPLLR